MRNRRLVQRGDRGTVLVIVAAFAIVAVLMLAAVIDLGNQRQEVKQVTLSTDAAALAAASAIDFSDSPGLGQTVDCGTVDSNDGRFTTVQDVAVKYWADNGGTGTIDCELVFHPVHRRTAYATVEVVETVDFAFAGATGMESGNASGSSSALVSDPSGGNLYPVAMCGGEAADALGAEESMVYPDGIEHTAVFTNAACGGSGNFRQVQFDPTRTGDECGGEGMWCYDFNNGGYSGAPQYVESDTGSNWVRGEDGILPLVEDGSHIWIVAVEYDDSGSGTGAIYEVTHFVEVVITEYVRNSSMAFDVYQIVPYDPAGPPNLTNETPVPAHLCATGQGTQACSFTHVAPEGEGPGDVDLDPECIVGDIDIDPQPVIVKTSPPGQSGRLESPFTVFVNTNGADNCSDLRVRLRGPETTDAGDVVNVGTCACESEYEYTGNDNFWDDAPGDGVVEIVNGTEVVASAAIELS